MKKLALISIIAYFIGFYISFSFQLEEQSYSRNQINKMDMMYLEIKSKTKIEKTISIIENNINIIAINIIGFLSFGIITMLNTMYNGFILGYIIRICSSINNQNVFIERIAPHFLEIIAIILSAIVGLFYGQYLLRFLQNKDFLLSGNTKDINLKAIPLCLFLVIVSGIMEVYVSMA